MAISESAQIGITTAFVVMIVTNVIGNSLVVLTVIKTRSMRTPMNYLLVNLAIADMTVGVFIAPRRVTRATLVLEKIKRCELDLFTGNPRRAWPYFYNRTIAEVGHP